MIHHPNRARRTVVSLTLCSLPAMAPAWLGGCSASLLPKAPPMPSLHALSWDDADAPPARAPAAGARVLAVLAPRAAAGFDGANMVYLRRPHEVEAFAQNAWVDTPSRMLTPLLVRALQRSAAFRAVLSAPGAAQAELALDTEIIRLQQDFGTVPSQVRFTLRAVLIDSATRRVLAWREFDQRVAARSEDPRGGVAAANQAARLVLDELVAFCDASLAS